MVSFARKDEAAVNSEPPSGTNALQVRQGAQDFRHRVREVAAVFSKESGRKGSAVFTAESLNRIDSLNPIGWASYKALHLPPQAPSEENPFRKQGIGRADRFND